MKSSDYIAKYLSKVGIGHVFEVTGGAVMHLIHSVATIEGIKNVPMAHEQGAALAADGYARAGGHIGAAMATSGPGATNLITGICSSYYDSIPTINITANVSYSKLATGMGIRQFGAQECDIINPIKHYTKYAEQVSDVNDIPDILNAAFISAMTDRKGPTLIDIPEDFTRSNIDVDDIILPTIDDELRSIDQDVIDEARRLIINSKAPLIVIGKGACSDINLTREFLRMINIPYVCTWPAISSFPSNDPNNLGTFGTHGNRYGNYAVQNADLLIIIGARIDSRALGAAGTFSPNSKKILVEIDPNEISKFNRLNINIDLPINHSAREFISSMIQSPIDYHIDRWLEYNSRMKVLYANRSTDRYDPYTIMRALSDNIDSDAVIAIDTGCTLTWVHQAFTFSGEQNLFHAYNFTPMGYSLPASIGARYATTSQVLSISGDGGFMMNSQELATIARHDLDIKIIVVANNEYGMIKGTQEEWLDSKYEGSDVEHGLGFPNWTRLADAYDIKSEVIKDMNDVNRLGSILNNRGPILIILDMNGMHDIDPKAMFGLPIDRQLPEVNDGGLHNESCSHR